MFAHKKLKKTTLKICSEKLKSTFFSLLPWAAQTAQTKEFMFQNVAYRPTVYRTGNMYLKSWKYIIRIITSDALIVGITDYHRKQETLFLTPTIILWAAKVQIWNSFHNNLSSLKLSGRALFHSISGHCQNWEFRPSI